MNAIQKFLIKRYINNWKDRPKESDDGTLQIKRSVRIHDLFIDLYWNTTRNSDGKKDQIYYRANWENVKRIIEDVETNQLNN